MKHANGINVFLQVQGLPLNEYTNPHEKRSKELIGAFGSRVITATPGTDFAVVVRFDPQFEKYKADGVMVTIAINPGTGNGTAPKRVQSTWLEFEHLNIHSEFTFSELTLWDSRAPYADASLETLRIPPCDPNYAAATSDWMDSEYYGANVGCISIAIERGKLSEHADNEPDYKWAPTDPPKIYRDSSIGLRVVRSEWFHWLKSDNGQIYLFEYRNVPSESADAAQKEAEEEIGHQSEDELDGDFEMVELDERDPLGAAEYEGEASFEAYNKAPMRRTRTTSQLSKRKRATMNGGVRIRSGRRVRVQEIEQTSGEVDEEEDFYSATPCPELVPAIASMSQRPSDLPLQFGPDGNLHSASLRPSAADASDGHSAFRTPDVASPPPEYMHQSNATAFNDMELEVSAAIEETQHFTETDTVVDLTNEDGKSPEIKLEPGMMEGNEELSDLEDQLKEVQLRRKIRAARRKQR